MGFEFGHLAMRIFKAISFLILLAFPAIIFGESNSFALLGFGNIEFSKINQKTNGGLNSAYSLRAGMLFNRYLSGEADWLSSHDNNIQFDSVALYLAHRRAISREIYGKVRFGVTRDRLDSDGILPATRQYGACGGVALGWKFDRWDVELDYTKLERDIQTLTVHFALFK